MELGLIIELIDGDGISIQSPSDTSQLLKELIVWDVPVIWL